MICFFCLRVGARIIVQADPPPRFTLHFAGTIGDQKQNKKIKQAGFKFGALIHPRWSGTGIAIPQAKHGLQQI